MKEKIKSNSGFTLIELIIAMAILAFMMTAICSFMGSSVASYKKSKADITVHNSAQETYDQITDSIMQATDIYVLGYMSTDGSDVLDFEYSDKPVQDSGVTLYYFVKDEEHENILKAMPEYIDGYEIKYYSDINSGSSIYVKELIIDNSVAIDMEFVTGSGAGVTEFTNALTGETPVEIVQEMTVDDTGASVLAESDVGNPVYNINDTVRNFYTFDGDTMYLERKHAFMTKLDDYYDSSVTGDKMNNYEYTTSLSYLNLDDTTTISGCTIVIDEDNGSVGVDLNFSDKNMTYTTLGMVNVRNSYVLKAKQ